MIIKASAGAKINLYLDITGRRSDGYHLIDTVMQSTDLCDTVTVSTDKSRSLTVLCENRYAPGGKNNIAYKAAEAFFEYANILNPGLCITLNKAIPVSAGLAGGSTDGAAVICVLNYMFNCNLTQNQLCEIGLKVGADLPFCIAGGTMRAEGIGEILTPVNNMPECYIVISKPDVGVSTKAAYEAIDSSENLLHPNASAVLEGLKSGSITDIAVSLGNIFETALKPEPVDVIKSIMIKKGALGCAMSGSGSAVFGIFEQKTDAEKCRDELRTLKGNCAFVCTPQKSSVVF